MARIQRLPQAMANMIAAGEVVERPAAIAKELVENALDAGARRVSVEASDGGRQLRVTDDGHGMDAADAPLAFERFATSKLRTEEDLWKLTTNGFRGEALASIAAVAKVELLTRHAADDLGTRVRIEGGSEPEVSPAGAPPGTTIAVTDLFFNTPARLKFLRAPATELGHLEDAVVALALAHPGVGISLALNGRKAFSTVGCKTRLDVAEAIFGTGFAEVLLPVGFETEAGRVEGLTSRPDATRADRSKQWLFLNGRWIKDPLLARAVVEAYAGHLPGDRQPQYVLEVQVDPALVDVNVPPQKREVRFGQPQRLFALVREGLIEAWTRHAPARSAGPAPRDLPASPGAAQEPFPSGPGAVSGPPAGRSGAFEPSVGHPPEGGAQGAARGPSAGQPAAGAAGTVREPSAGYPEAGAPEAVQGPSASRPGAPANTGDWRHWDFGLPPKGTLPDLPMAAEPGAPYHAASRPGAVQGQSGGAPSPAAPPRAGGPTERETEAAMRLYAPLPGLAEGRPDVGGPLDRLRIIGQLGLKYILCEHPDGLYVVDQHNGHERWLYEQLQPARTVSQQLLLPLALTLSKKEQAVAESVTPRLAELGFEVDALGPDGLIVRALPALLPREEAEGTLRELLSGAEDTGVVVRQPDDDPIRRTIACHSAVRAGTPLSFEQMTEILNRLRETKNPLTCPHGRPTAFLVSERELDKRCLRA